MDVPYKIYKTSDSKVFATFFFDRQEEIIVNKFKKMVRIYDESHALVRLIEKIGKQTMVYKINPETNGISCEIYNSEDEV